MSSLEVSGEAVSAEKAELAAALDAARLAMAEEMLHPGFLVGPDKSESLTYEEWMGRAEIPLEFAEVPEVRELYEQFLPPQWAHHEFYFRLIPDMAGSS